MITRTRTRIRHQPRSYPAPWAVTPKSSGDRLWGGVRSVGRPSFVNVRRLDIGIVPMVQRMHETGLLIDIDWMENLTSKLRREKEELATRIDEISHTHTTNLGSGDQVAHLLFDHLRVPTSGKVGSESWSVHKTKSGARFSTADEWLELVSSHLDDDHPHRTVVRLVQDWRERDKLEDSYTVPLMKRARESATGDNRVRATLKLTSVETGRLSCSDPNFMAIPTRTELGKEVRMGIIARRGCRLLRVDESQIEMRLAAHYSKDRVMKAVFESGGDIHSETASRMFDIPIHLLDKDLHRYPAKRVGFGVLFGITAEGLLAQMKASGALGWTVERCQDLIDRWFKVYSDIRRWMGEQWARARRYGLVWDWVGRVRWVPEIRSAHRHIVEAGLRQAGNTSIQSGAQATIKLAMAEIHCMMEGYRQRGWICEPLMQIHDEILSEVEDEIADEVGCQMVEIIENCVKLEVPIAATMETGESWVEREKGKKAA